MADWAALFEWVMGELGRRGFTLVGNGVTAPFGVWPRLEIERLELPPAEAAQAWLCMGMAEAGRDVVCYYPRHEFALYGLLGIARASIEGVHGRLRGRLVYWVTTNRTGGVGPSHSGFYLGAFAAVSCGRVYTLASERAFTVLLEHLDSGEACNPAVVVDSRLVADCEGYTGPGGAHCVVRKGGGRLVEAHLDTWARAVREEGEATVVSPSYVPSGLGGVEKYYSSAGAFTVGLAREWFGYVRGGWLGWDSQG